MLVLAKLSLCMKKFYDSARLKVLTQQYIADNEACLTSRFLGRHAILLGNAESNFGMAFALHDTILAANNTLRSLISYSECMDACCYTSTCMRCTAVCLPPPWCKIFRYDSL